MKKLYRIAVSGLIVCGIAAWYAVLVELQKPVEFYGIVIKKDSKNCLIEMPQLRQKQWRFTYWQVNDTLQVGDTIKTFTK